MRLLKMPISFAHVYLILALTFALQALGANQVSCPTAVGPLVSSVEAAVEEFRLNSMEQNAPHPVMTDPELRHLFKTGVQGFHSGRTFEIKGITYKVEGLLGESSSKVYRAISPGGTKVVIKDVPSEKMFIFEIRLTEYLLSQGFEVPKIIGTHGHMIVKEYFSGLTPSEVKKTFRSGQYEKFGWHAPDMNRLFQEVEVLNEKYLELVKERFAIWLQNRYPDDFAQLHKQLTYILYEGDDKTENFLYSVTHQRWLRYDP